MTVARRRGVTDVTYDARIRFRRLLRLADPFLAIGFRVLADRALHGFEQRLPEAA